MNEREKNKELIKRMAETLRNHAAPYREGAWEQFSAQYGPSKKRAVKWPYWAAAAVLLVAAGLFVFDGQRQDELGIAQSDSVRQHTAPVADADQSFDPTVLGNAIESEEQKQSIPTRKLIAANEATETKAISHAVANQDTLSGVAPQQLLAVVHAVTEQDSANRQTAYLDNTLTIAAVTQDTLLSDTDLLAGGVTKSDELPSSDLKITANPAVTEPIGQVPENGFLDQQAINETYASITTKERNEAKKWDLGLVISPSLTSEKVNIGGGIAVAYRLSDRFSLGSGVSVGELGVAQNQQIGRLMDYVAAPSDISSGFFESSSYQHREVTSVTSNLLAIDIPLDLRYNVTERFYTSVGVSFLTILNEQRTNHFVDRINQPTFGGNNSRNQDLASSVRAVYSSERTAQQPLEGRGYTGFVNFSIGRTMPLSSKLSLSIEPYFKLPVGRLSREDMDFTNGGIRIITGF